LLREAKQVRQYLQVDSLMPSPAKIRDDLEKFRRSALLIRARLNDRALVAYLGHHGEAAGYSAFVIEQIVDDLILQAQNALIRVPQGQGKRVAYPFRSDETLSGPQLCAWVIRQAIKEHKGSRPGVRNIPASDAANFLLQLADGQELGPESWVKHFAEISKLEKSETRLGRELRKREPYFASQPGPPV